MRHASESLTDLSLKTRIKLTTTYKTLNSDYLCDNSGLFSFIRKEVIKTTYFQDCGTMMSNNGGAHMLLTNQDIERTGIARTKSICKCTNGWVMDSMAIPVEEFSREEYKISFWLKINCIQMKLPDFENWSNGKVSKSDKIWLSKSIYYVKNHQNLSDFFFIEKYELSSTFFDNINF